MSKNAQHMCWRGTMRKMAVQLKTNSSEVAMRTDGGSKEIFGNNSVINQGCDK